MSGNERPGGVVIVRATLVGRLVVIVGRHLGVERCSDPGNRLGSGVPVIDRRLGPA
jgi:hypothetical protein